ncbi:hypothetical protein PPERSA_05134 [Pseudocohnilembus persalinus]|uniref:Uncharacterized protein n=1 Tax=Pseudocohnilembus persalinus TaxID=266149 RepID=A0A0V0QVW0_PSEPJ|nr:hypothetical protein PPERSA_05134 [Pseudocohnilembus persalinus]|eukprot:KRX06521.1 hypothetical protein PPERSA_05134 [Pseudocohnilembus persalinus]
MTNLQVKIIERDLFKDKYYDYDSDYCHQKNGDIMNFYEEKWLEIKITQKTSLFNFNLYQADNQLYIVKQICIIMQNLVSFQKNAENLFEGILDLEIMAKQQ